MPAVLAAAAAGMAAAQPLQADASAVPAAPREGLLQMGEGRGPQGHIAVNDRYLTLNGRPWFPVMGEFHYSRYPAADWEEQLLKMKAAGVGVVASYVVWAHHAPTSPAASFEGQRDLRRFVQLAQRHGLLVFLRPGPWVHAELRFGGLPDWLVDSVPTRRNDAQYLAHTETWFAQVAQQLRGLLWKEGGPVIGLQIENEYNRSGPLQGREHIAQLKQLLRAQGLDVPLYTATGWDRAVFPRGEVIPVFGSYVDEPWSARSGVLPPRTSYVFQFGVRNEQGLGAQGRTSSDDDGERDLDITPFFGAEYGAGVPQMYRRRPLIAPQDIAAMVLTKLGSGVNLLGYYMFHGGQNPPAWPPREETIASGGWNDVPRLNYDFQAPLGQYGQAQPVLFKLLPLHHFLQGWGEVLAPMVVHAPAQRPTGSDDLQTLRWAVRSDGQRGFVFVNNHVRQHTTPAHANTQFAVQLQGGTLTLPSRGVTVAPGAAFVWPLRLDLGGVELAWASAQPLTRIADGESAADGELQVFMASGDIAPEFAFTPQAARRAFIGGRRAEATAHEGLRVYRPAAGEVLHITSAEGRRARLVWLPQAVAERVARVALQGRTHLVWSEGAHVHNNASGAVVLRQTAPAWRFGLYPAARPALQGSLPLQRGAREGLFEIYSAQAQAVAPTVQVQPLRAAGRLPAPMFHGPRNTVVMPLPETWAAAAGWTLQLPAGLPAGLSELYLDIEFEGDIARLFKGTELLDDSYAIGQPWRVGLRRHASHLAAAGQPASALTLGVLPLREDAKVHFEPGAAPTFEQGQALRLKSVRLVPEYTLQLR
ncbi:hypothetical protein IP87_16895 [beta proteobacterium AAP121]|nr:hypothetical protein IP80_13805 [beta proteobacterium AAP65]KPF95386.1 hypothetical protein IP87_16895 [beta proteobacterium AAP121]